MVPYRSKYKAIVLQDWQTPFMPRLITINDSESSGVNLVLQLFKNMIFYNTCSLIILKYLFIYYYSFTHDPIYDKYFNIIMILIPHFFLLSSISFKHSSRTKQESEHNFENRVCKHCTQYMYELLVNFDTVLVLSKLKK